MQYTVPTLAQIRESLVSSGIRYANMGQTDSTKLIDGSIANNAFVALAEAPAGALFDQWKYFEYLKREMLPTTSIDNLEDQAGVDGYYRKQSSKSKGYAIFTGLANTNIPLNALLQSSDGYQFQTTETNDITLSTASVLTITRSGSIVTVTTASNHNLANDILVSISGANQVDYNVISKPIQVISANSFTFTISETPTTPATGTILFSATYVKIGIESVSTGVANNLEYASTLSMLQSIAGVQSIVYIDYYGVQGGSDLEDLEVFRARYLESKKSNLPRVSAGGLKNYILNNVSGITRVWVLQNNPSVGYFTVLFVRDGDTNPIPTTLQANDLKTIITNQDNGCLVANTNPFQVYVEPPEAVYVDITFTTLSINDTIMRDAITQNIDFFFSENTDLGQDIILGELINTIKGTVDSKNRTPNFTLSLSTDIVINTKQIAFRRNIIFPS